MREELENSHRIARWQYRAAMSRGHSAQCETVWKYENCTCPGRLALHGGEIARKLDFDEEQARQEFRNAEIALDNFQD